MEEKGHRHGLSIRSVEMQGPNIESIVLGWNNIKSRKCVISVTHSVLEQIFTTSFMCD